MIFKKHCMHFTEIGYKSENYFIFRTFKNCILISKGLDYHLIAQRISKNSRLGEKVDLHHTHLLQV